MHVEQPLEVVHPDLHSAFDETGVFPSFFHLNGAGCVDSMGVLVPRECVRMERSEDVTHPVNRFILKDMWAMPGYGCAVAHNVRQVP